MPIPSKPKPPVKNGVGASVVALPSGPWRTALEFVVQRFPAIGQHEWQARFARNEVLDQDCATLTADSTYQSGGKLYYYKRVDDEPRVPFQESILFQDSWLVVADKPHFLPVISTGRYVRESLLVRLKERLGLDDLAPIHRIDRETAGIVVFAVQPSTRDRYMELFRRRAVEKYYEAIAPHRPNLTLPMTCRNRLTEGDSFMQMRISEGEANAESMIERLEVLGKSARYGIKPMTGKRHQIRVHMASLGIPIVNDRIYPHLLPASKSPSELSIEYEAPLQLLAKHIAFIDPISKEHRSFESRLTLKA